MTYELAYKSFLEIGQILYLHCEKIEVAGSVRRALISPELQKREVKDVEIVALPQTESSGLFDDVPVRSKEFCAALEQYVIVKGDIKTGRYVKIAYPHDVNIDLFLPTKEDFYRQFAIRTGSADFARSVLATGWRKLGWAGTKDGLRRESECSCSAHTELGISAQKQVWTCKAINPTLPPVWESEKDFFKWLNIEYVEPSFRG